MKILLADDDRDLVDLLGYAFQREGYIVATAFDGEAALRTFRVQRPDLVVLDLLMPKRGGMEVLQELRNETDVPIVVLSAIADEDHIVNALYRGADDYMVKPFRPRELRARTKALLRRFPHHSDRPRSDLALTLGEIALDPRRREVFVRDRGVRLTRIEFSLLHYLMLNCNTVLGHDELLNNVWGYLGDQDENVIKVSILRLRRKIEMDPKQPRYILNVPGVGYTFRNDSP